MDKNVIEGLINSISRLIHLAACESIKSTYLEGIRIIIQILKLLKPVLDEVLDITIPSDGKLTRIFEELDIALNESREFAEKRTQKMSRIFSVLQSEPMVLKIRDSSIEICYVLSRLLQSSSFVTQSAKIQHCMQELQFPEQDLPSALISNALKDQKENIVPRLDDIIKIMETLSLTSTHELLMENIALQKESMKAELEKNSDEVNRIKEIIILINHVQQCMIKLEQFGFICGVSVPLYFRCPLSLKLMQDPVIVASGQTYERSFIQKWLDSGLRICPKTCQTLAHTNLIPNFTVKALIANWCEDNNIKLPDYVQHDCIDSNSRPSADYRSEISFACKGEESSSISIEKLTGEQQSCTHSRSESLSSAISSTDISSKFDEKVCLLEVTHSLSSSSNKDMDISSWLPRLGIFQNEHNSNTDDLTPISHVNKLIEDLKCHSPEVQIAAALELRLLTKHNMDNRVLIAKCGAISPLIFALTSKVKKIQENAVTALLNLSINDSNKILIAEAGALEPLIHVLESGSPEAQENSAATLFSLSVLEEYKAKIGRSGAIKALVHLLGFGSLRGKKDAATALFNLSIFYENKARIVQAGAVKYLVELMDPGTCMVDKSVALLANLSTISEGQVAIAREGGIPLLVEIVDTGTQRGKENAASVLFQLCINSPKFCSLVLQEGAIPPLVALSQFGTPRAKEKAQQILSHFRSQRERTVRKTKP